MKGGLPRPAPLCCLSRPRWGRAARPPRPRARRGRPPHCRPRRGYPPRPRAALAGIPALPFVARPRGLRSRPPCGETRDFWPPNRVLARNSSCEGVSTGKTPGRANRPSGRSPISSRFRARTRFGGHFGREIPHAAQAASAEVAYAARPDPRLRMTIAAIRHAVAKTSEAAKLPREGVQRGEGLHRIFKRFAVSCRFAECDIVPVPLSQNVASSLPAPLHPFVARAFASSSGSSGAFASVASRLGALA